MTDNLPERVGAIETKLDALSSSVDQRFDDIDQRFKDVTSAIVEQREYTECALSRLRREMIERFERIERTMATRDQVERLRIGTAEHFQRLEQRCQSLEDKLDRFIDAHSRPTRRRTRATKKA